VFETFKAKKRLLALEERIDTLQREFRALQLEWEDSYDKLRHMMGRVSKRAEQMHDKAESSLQLFPGEPEATNGGNALTPGQLAANARIMARRARLTIGRKVE
jgi:hypothetical protein